MTFGSTALRTHPVHEVFFFHVEPITARHRILTFYVPLFNLTLFYTNRIILWTRHNLTPISMNEIKGYIPIIDRQEWFSCILTMAVVQALDWWEITPHNPPTCLYVPLLTNCVTSGESMALDPPIMHNDVAFSFGRIVGAASLSAFSMQLICRPSDIGNVSAIIAPVNRSYARCVSSRVGLDQPGCRSASGVQYQRDPCYHI
jgi:hypothetical protein